MKSNKQDNNMSRRSLGTSYLLEYVLQSSCNHFKTTVNLVLALQPRLEGETIIPWEWGSLAEALRDGEDKQNPNYTVEE